MEPLEERVAALEARCVAYEIVLLDLVHCTWPVEQHRVERRESACKLIEAGLANAVNQHGHLHLQRILAMVEEIYGSQRPSPDE